MRSTSSPKEVKKKKRVDSDHVMELTTTKHALESAIKKLGEKVDLKDVGEPSYILGIENTWDKVNKKLTLNRKKYISDILKRYSQGKDSNGNWSNNNVGQTTEGKAESTVPYQNLIGNLMYMVQGTRPDIAFATHYLSEFNTSFTSTHWQMAKRVLRYLQGTKDVGITYTACAEPVVGYCDASWNESGKGKSRTAYVFTVSKGAISRKSTKQQVVALSTCEAEYIAITEAIKKVYG
ncbi:uncharacterized protein LOC135392483 [Ornithodoros turicata]|uniref:uncharacterized protein LOC135392483 n=1 Tax=Ornithodoros turicata TaxID=34597 RepID=UPI00313917DF